MFVLSRWRINIPLHNVWKICRSYLKVKVRKATFCVRFSSFLFMKVNTNLKQHHAFAQKKELFAFLFWHNYVPLYIMSLKIFLLWVHVCSLTLKLYMTLFSTSTKTRHLLGGCVQIQGINQPMCREEALFPLAILTELWPFVLLHIVFCFLLLKVSPTEIVLIIYCSLSYYNSHLEL